MPPNKSKGKSKAVSSAATPSTLLSFFPVIPSRVPHGTRRPLQACTDPPRKKPLTSGRTNPLPIPLLPEAAQAVFHRCVRPINVSSVQRPPGRNQTVAVEGARDTRDEPLTVDDLWRPGGGPPHLNSVADEDRCSICLQLKSHPVFYKCGHGHCYTCARIWLEEQWTCPVCKTIITQRPFRINDVEALLVRIYGDWDTSTVVYDWSGLTFPVVSEGGT